MAAVQHRKILCAVDFSPHSAEALEVAARTCAVETDLLIVHVWQPFGESFGSEPLFSGDIVASIIASAEGALARAKQDAERFGARRVTTLLLRGTPWDQIVTLAAKRSCDLIVMGTHGRSGLAHLLLGSVAERVLRHAPCSVLVVRLAKHLAEHHDERGQREPDATPRALERDQAGIDETSAPAVAPPTIERDTRCRSYRSDSTDGRSPRVTFRARAPDPSRRLTSHDAWDPQFLDNPNDQQQDILFETMPGDPGNHGPYRERERGPNLQLRLRTHFSSLSRYPSSLTRYPNPSDGEET